MPTSMGSAGCCCEMVRSNFSSTGCAVAHDRRRALPRRATRRAQRAQSRATTSEPAVASPSARICSPTAPPATRPCPRSLPWIPELAEAAFSETSLQRLQMALLQQQIRSRRALAHSATSDSQLQRSEQVLWAASRRSCRRIFACARGGDRGTRQVDLQPETVLPPCRLVPRGPC